MPISWNRLLQVFRHRALSAVLGYLSGSNVINHMSPKRRELYQTRGNKEGVGDVREIYCVVL